ncbi:penicillin-binding protein 2 [Kangiella sp. TOML190]|uniref:penicillin-binding protein 2 n=1 Tax=Kangiella sp. TOML190 TaxID=2931351 RepID=UPI0020404170|nr:penicillin-binding protein 2 [Kangiella sp. TOML190]
MYKKQAIKDYGREISVFYARSVIALIIVVGLLLVLLFRQFKLQVINYETYQTQSENNRIQVRPVAPIRGLIFDRNGILLAENRSIFTLEVTPNTVGRKNMESTLERLSQLLDIDKKQLDEFKEQIKFRSKYKSYPIKSKLTEQQVALFAVNRHQFPGVSIEARLERYYPHGEELVHAIGRMAAITKDDVDKMQAKAQESQDFSQVKNYAATNKMGKLGLERFYEAILHGQVGEEKVETDVRGRIVRVLERTEPVAGKNLYLHMDYRLQQKAYQTLKESKVRGAVVAVDPATGGVLALVSQPAYDPNLFTGGISSSDYSALIQSKDRPLYNRAVQGTYAPASTIKPHLAWVGLQQGVITEKTRVRDPGWFSLPNNDHRYRDWKPWGHAATMDVFDSIVQSCDTFFYDLSVRIGINKISEGMRQFGFGEKTGIDIVEEKIGIMPSRAWKKEMRKEPWYMGDTVNIGIGQGFWTATPLQLANSIAVLANDGIRFNLQLVKNFAEGSKLDANVPVMAHEQIEAGDGHWLDIIKEAMHEVTKPPYGTAKTAFDGADFTAAGKTGTGQVKSIAQDETYDAESVEDKYRDNALFVGYAPYEQPQIAIAVVMENAGGGGGNAAPIARQLMEFYLDLNKERAQLAVADKSEQAK